MKTPFFNEQERLIIRDDNSLLASCMKLFIARKKFEKTFIKTLFGRFIRVTVDWLAGS